MDFIIIALILLFAVLVIVRYVRNLGKGCCDSGSSSVREIPVIDKTIYKNTATIPVKNISCINCIIRIERKLNSSKEYQVIGNLKEKSITVYAKEEIPFTEIKERLNEIGYDI